MTWRVNISPILTPRLQSTEQGILVVATDASSQALAVVGSVLVADGRFQETADAVTALLPQGLAVAGTYTSSSTPASWQPSSSAVQAIVSAINTAASPSWTVNGKAVEFVAADSNSNGIIEDAGLNCVPGFVPLRCHLDMQLPIPTANSNGNTASTGSISPAAVQAALQQLQDTLLSQQLACVSEPLGQQQQVLISSSSRGSIQEVFSSSSASFDSPCISLVPLQHTGMNGTSSAPMFEYQPNKQQQTITNLTLGLDVLCYAPDSMPGSEVLQSLIVLALKAQLATMQQQLTQQAAQGQTLTPIRAYHFQPPGLGCLPITICYSMLHQSAETTELKLLGQRQQLHQVLGLPDNVPMLRFSNALSWAAAGQAEGQNAPRALRLRNVHEGLVPPGFGGQLYLIDGAYEYYHYMQDKFNDNGWGCAYRSLQTIISWFRLQKYTSKPIPSHRQIQEVLVSLGDKESSFVGSNNWIGAIELSYILDEYLGITSKVITVNRGSDIPSNARALAQHFAIQGTPVMIGGGVLAYTLLGVAFNEDTGEAAFLILDPHYTGGEDLKKIHQGTWVAWKQLGDNAAAGGPLFVKDAFYNFLCPQRPRTV